MNIFDQVKSLNLPLGKYVVIGGGVMSAHGLREHKDVDLLVTQGLYEELKAKGWKTKMITLDFETLVDGEFEASPEVISLPGYKPDVISLIQNADIINGVAFIPLREVINFKRALGRESDLRDIVLIEEHLK